MTTSTGLSDDNCTLASALPPLRLRLSSVSNANFLCIAIVDTITHVSSSPNISHRNGTPQVQRQKAADQIGQGLAQNPTG